MRVLVTRPEADASRLSARLEAAGHSVIAAPLLDIIFEDADASSFTGFQAILLTSANGARALARLSPKRDTPILSVGDATARTARDLGFSDVRTAGGDVAALSDLAARTLDPGAGPLLHVAGTVVAGDLKGALEAQGFTVDRIAAYRAEAIGALPAGAVEALRAHALDCALFYSPRTAQIFADLIAAAGLAEALRTVTAACLSPAVRDALQSLPWRRIVVAEMPVEGALLAASGLESPRTTTD